MQLHGKSEQTAANGFVGYPKLSRITEQNLTGFSNPLLRLQDEGEATLLTAQGQKQSDQTASLSITSRQMCLVYVEKSNRPVAVELFAEVSAP